VSEAVDQPDWAPPPDVGGHGPPWEGGLEVTESQLKELNLRRFEEDYKRLLKSLYDNGSLTVVPDP